MSAPKRHHYVPRVYLEEFTSDDGKLLVIEKPSGKCFPSVPSNAAVIAHQNTVYFDDGTKDQETVESFFGNIEQDYPRYLQQVRDGYIDGDTIDFFVTLSIHQRMRTPRVRKQLADLVVQFDEKGALDHLKHTFSAHELSLLNKAKGRDKKALNQLGLSLSGHYAISTGLILEGMRFAFLRNETDLNLVSCDNPATVSGVSIDRRQTTGLLPLPSNRRVLIFPISRDFLLYGDTTLKSELGFIVFRDKPTLRRATVTRVNNLTALSADRYVFQSEDQARPQTSCIRNRLDDEKQALRVFRGPFSKCLSEAVRDLRSLAL
ncbi:DUF4238 domain-containing protein [uncultured Roseovarius sp.]|uniref:DUF4238 domain-containing protein n=1 Tax=uncultured Roseovarius sp. TaxID=293344 RepID=UPI000C4F14DB|nr:hypothetical protein [Roseovarius sp.]MBD12197.1 hypothetical protein [Roseovarius sp.]